MTIGDGDLVMCTILFCTRPVCKKTFIVWAVNRLIEGNTVLELRGIERVGNMRKKLRLASELEQVTH